MNVALELTNHKHLLFSVSLSTTVPDLKSSKSSKAKCVKVKGKSKMSRSAKALKGATNPPSQAPTQAPTRKPTYVKEPKAPKGDTLP